MHAPAMEPHPQPRPACLMTQCLRWGPGPLFPLSDLHVRLNTLLCFVTLDTWHAWFGYRSSSSLPGHSSFHTGQSQRSEPITAPETETRASSVQHARLPSSTFPSFTSWLSRSTVFYNIFVYFLSYFFCVYLLLGRMFPKGKLYCFVH